jgi:dolichyl-phosphate beta-glucosyltransferase
VLFPSAMRLPDDVVVEPPQPADGRAPAISIVIPAYNEAGRILPHLAAIDAHFAARGEPYEVLVVDDGSRDRTADTIRELLPGRPWLRLVRYERNRGKGHAVRMGMLIARGTLRLMTDADGSTPIEELERLLARRPAAGPFVIVGSRALPAPDVRRIVKLHRRLIGEVFSALKRLLLDVRVRDSQCGFKLLGASPAEALFGSARVDGFAFDVEILFLAAKAGIPVIEVAVNWHDAGESRVRLLSDPLKMAWDVWRIRRLHKHTVLAVGRERSGERGRATRR